MYKLTAADFADTGQWRLLIRIGSRGLVAFLENTIHPEVGLQEMCKVSWKATKSDLKNFIEETVYNYPRLLDDFATRIILYDAEVMFLPTDIAESGAGSEEALYKKIYEGKAEDIMTDRDEDITAVWCPGKGVKSFLMRTFPGARISCNLMEKIRNLRKDAGKSEISLSDEGKMEIRELNCGETNEDVLLLTARREEEGDVILMKGKGLISAATYDIASEGQLHEIAEQNLAAYGFEKGS